MPYTKSRRNIRRRQPELKAEEYARQIKDCSNALDVYVKDKAYPATVRKINYIQTNLNKLREIVENKLATTQRINWKGIRSWQEGVNVGLLSGIVGSLITATLIHFTGDGIGIVGGLVTFAVIYYFANK